MFALVLAGMIGSALMISQSAAADAQLASAVGPTEDASARAASTLVKPVQPGQSPYSRLFSVPESDFARASGRAALLGGITRPDDTSAVADMVCGMRVLRGNPDVDPGIFMPRRDADINFTIRRITPPCLDRGRFVPRRER